MRISLVLLSAMILFLAPRAKAVPVMRVVQPDAGGTNLLSNSGFETLTSGQFKSWSAGPQGWTVSPNAGRNNSQALACTAANTQGWYGASQTLQLNHTNAQPVVISGWSRAEGVSDSADNDYSLYVDIIYRDGTPLWGQTANFTVGSHDWEQRKFVILPEKPIKSLTLYCLFRHHTGQVWFDDVSVGEVSAPVGAFVFQGTPMAVVATNASPTGAVQHFNTGDQLDLALTGGQVTGLALAGRELAVAAPSGFLVRDMAARSDMFAFENGACPELNLTLSSTITAHEDHLVVEGAITDTTGHDRAVMLLFALPVDAAGWSWGQNIREQRAIVAPSELSATVAVNCGANGQQSLYPLACVNDAQSGLALGVDLGKPAQYRGVYHAGTKQLFLAYDLGLVAGTTNFPSSAGFRLVIYRFDPSGGFRSAWQKYMRIFPDYFQVRAKEQGIWMPFTDVSTVNGWQDFGFRFHEGNNNVAFDDQHGVLSFRYTEPMTWWMNMATNLPRTAAAALQARDAAAAGPVGQTRTMALISQSAAMWDATGQPALLFRNEPWSNGAVWSLNPNPHLPANPNAATVYWNDTIRQSLYGSGTTNGLDGEYLDSLEGYVTADLNFRSEHFTHTTVPLTFDTETGRPALWKGLAVAEFTRWISEDLHRLGKLCFANGVPYRFNFLCPWLDVMGTETDWQSSGQYSPSSHAQMALWRTLSGAKPYLLLMNTDFSTFDTNRVERYFQRSLLYGMYPSMFSFNASENPYWQKPAWYNRDRALFKRYQPVIKEVAQAGWQPVTMASCENTNVLMERFGPAADGSDYFTVFNDSTSAVNAQLKLNVDGPNVNARRAAFEMLSGARLATNGTGWELNLEPQACVTVKLLPQAKFLNAARTAEGGIKFSVLAPLGSTQVLDASDNLADWRPVGTNTISQQPQEWVDTTASGAVRFYRLRW